MNVVLLTTWDFSSVRTTYSDNPELVSSWLDNEDALVSDELVKHVVAAGSPYATDAAEVRDQLMSTPKNQDDKILSLASLLPNVDAIYAEGFTVVDKYDMMRY